MLISTPFAPSIDASSSSGDEMARCAASTARCSPERDAGAHERHAHAVHDRLHVGEVEVDLAGDGDEVGDALHRLAQDVVGDLERLVERRAALDEVEQPLVRDGDERVDRVAQRADALLGLHAAALPFEAERLRDHGHGQRAELRGQRGDDRRGAGAGAAAHAGGDEDHVGAAERLEDAIGVFERGLLADSRDWRRRRGLW